ncbi:MAG TPA: SpoIIE family protein phosphatase [Candidatus Acidoferrales bacterium]|nr:SpoIIE family protein phosphatase [Candidatus Acidoferrales bacterium]
MATIGDAHFTNELEARREELVSAIEISPDQNLTGLLAEVDSALARLRAGTFGICESCHDSVEFDRLTADPLVRFCLDHLSEPERRAHERDVETAASIQRTLLPPAEIRIPGWHIHYRYQPAGPVSGDFCDVIHSSNGQGGFVFLLGDVSGKGISASMLMAQLHAMFRSLIPTHQPIAEVLGMANRLFCKSTNHGLYATLVCGRATADGRVEIGNAGHPPVWLSGCREASAIGATGLPLGMFSSSRYSTTNVRLDPDHSLILYTDGLSELRGQDGVEYGESRLREFAEANRRLDPVALSDAFLNDVKTYSAGARPFDDLTLMVIRREAA